MSEPNPVRIDQLLACGDPDRPALTHRSVTVGYAELADRVARVAAGLHARGVRRGDRVAVYAEKRVETVVAMLAVSAAGAVLVPLNPAFLERQVRHVVADCGPRVVITTAERRGTVHAALTSGDTAGGGPADGTHGPDVRVIAIGTAEWDELAATEPAPVPDAEAVIDQDIAAILYTSGSTGGPKGVVLSHRNLLAGAASVAGYLRHTADDVVLAVLPLSFDAGFSQLTTALIAGAHVVLVNYLRPGEVVRLCAAHRVTALTCVPPLWLQLAAHEWPAEATASLRYFANTGGRMPRATLASLRRIFPEAAPYLMYGLTEAFRSTYLDPGLAGLHPDSIGKAIPNAEILVVRQDGTPCEPGEPGELVHRGALVALGYWNDPERTAERFRPVPGPAPAGRPETAVWSGDTVYRDTDGYLYFTGRADDMIKTSGYRVSPTEVEEAAYATGLVAEAVALGVPDDRLGEQIVLIVSVRGPGPDEAVLLAALAREIPAYMLPRRVEVLPELPRSVNGKFDRVELRRAVRRTSEELSC
jgi:acyl-CoA ligase (AMP-forming) (exosortase A-associated)